MLAWVGSSGELSDAAEVDGVLAPRQPGSTLKPFLYAQAIAEQRLTAASLLDDSPTQINTAGGLYIPQNYDRQFKGWVSVRTALAASLNVPAVRTLVMVSPESFARQLRAVGLPLKQTGDYYGYSLALGSAEVSLLDLSNAYRTLANGGRYGAVRMALPSPLPPPRGRGSEDGDAGRTVLPSPPPSPGGRRSEDGGAGRVTLTSPLPSSSGRGIHTRNAAQAVIDPRAAFIVGDILSDPNARARTFGTDSLLATRFWSAVKTGTSKDMRDNWAVGWTARHTVGVWVGNASGAPMHDVSGISGAAPVWAALVQVLQAHGADHSSPGSGRRPAVAPAPTTAPTTAPMPQPPPGLQALAVRFGPTDGSTGQAPIEAARTEWFLSGTGQALFSMNSIAANDHPTLAIGQKSLKSVENALPGTARITAPADGTILALDPDIPPANQRLALRASAPGVRWQIDGKPLATGAHASWLPWPGRHTLSLVSADGQTLDQVRVEVRGAGVKSAARK